MPADRIVVGLDVDALAVVREVIPVAEHRAEARDQVIGDLARARGIVIVGFSGSTQPSADAPVRMTSIGCAAGRQLLEHRAHRRRAGRAGS